MTVSKIDFSRAAYLYAQALDNRGASEYWWASESVAGLESMLINDVRTAAIRDAIDRLQVRGRTWVVAGMTCQVTLAGECVITIRPLTRDVNGRISPVLLLFNALATARSLGERAWADIPSYMQRELASDDQENLARMKRVLTWPRFIIFLHIFFLSRSPGND